MHRRTFLHSLCLSGAGTLISGLSGFAQSTKKNPPNIIMILVDDMGYSDIGCYGGEVDTPNLNYLAENGIRFTQMHNTSKCFPSRACLLTGVYAQQNGMSKGYEKFTNAVTLGEVMRSTGYRTLASGKHHSRESLYDRGFDRYFGLLDGAGNHFNPGFQRKGEPKPCQKKYGGRLWAIDEKVLTPYTPPEKDFYTTDYFTKYAINYLEEYKNENKPFFIYLAYTAPHDPLQAWPKDIEKYKDTYKAGYQAIRKTRYKRMRKLGIPAKNVKLSKQTCKDWNSLDDKTKKIEAAKMGIYAAMIDRVDQNIGLLIDKLKKLNKLDNTLIMFASDNGCSAENAERKVKKRSKYPDGAPIDKMGTIEYWASLGKNWANVSDTPFRYYKNYSYEGGICTPFIAFWPGKIKNRGSINSTFYGHFIDVMATLVDITKADYPKEHRGEKITPMQGESLLPIFLGEKNKERKKALFWQWKKGKAVRKGKWKAVTNGRNWELFDMSEDMSETNDLSSKYPEKLLAMQKKYKEWYKSTPASREKSSKKKRKR